MAKNTTIKVKGEFDASQMLQSLQEVRKNLQNLGVPTREFERFDKQFEKANQLASQLSAQMQTGFSNTKQIDNFERSYGRLDVMLTQLRNTLSTLGDNVDINVDSTQLNKLKTNLQNLENARSNMLAAAKEEITNNKKNLNLNQNQVKSLQEQVENAENLKQLLKDIGRERYAKLANKVSDLDTEAMNISIGANTDIHKSALKNITDGGDEQLIGKAYQTALTETVGVLGSGEMALNTFVRELQNYNITLKDSEEALRMLNADIDDAISSGVSSPSQKGTINMMRNRAQAIGMPMDNGDFQLGGGAANIVSNASNLENNAISITNTQNAVLAQEAADARQAAQAVNELTQNIQETERAHGTLSSSVTETTNELRQESENAQQLQDSFKRMKDAIKAILSVSGVWRMISRVAKETFQDISKLDEAFAKIAMVTNKSVAEMWSSYSSYADMAKRLGQNTTDAIKASALFYQQGLDTKEALSLTEDTMKLATLSGQDFQKATEQMTAALRGFHMEMEAGSHITDVYSELAANAAADVHGIAYAMSKTASIANSAGMSFENTSAFLTQMIETTQEAPENIGTAMKTIIARFTELKENVAGTTESEFQDLDYNKVDKALKSVGVSLKDDVGQFRNLDDVFLELSKKWNTLDRNSQRYIATIAAGSRQQSRFIAMMENYERTMELVEVAQDSAGRSEEQFAKYQDTVEYKVNRLKTTWEELRVSLLNSDGFKKAIDLVTSLLERISQIDFKKLLALSPIVISLAKNFVMTFIDTAQSMTKQYQQLGTTIGETIKNKINEAISNSPLPIQTQIRNIGAETDLRTIQMQRYTDASGEAVALSQMFGLTGQEMYNLTEDSEEYKRILEAIGGDEAHLQNELHELALVEEETGTSALEAGQRIEELGMEMEHSKQQAKLMSQGIQMIGQVLATGLTAWISTGDFEAGLDAILASTAAFGVQMVMSLATTFATAAIEAHAGGVSIGTALTEGLAATGPGLVIAAILAGLAAIVAATKFAIKYYKETHKSIDQQIQESEEKIKELQKQAAELKDEADTKREQSKDIEETIERYEELNQIQLKTEEQQQEFNDLIEKIRNDFPEIVKSYDEQNNKLVIQKELWEEIADRAKQAARDSENAYLGRKQSVIKEQQNEIELQKEKVRQEDFVHAGKEGDLDAALKKELTFDELVAATRAMEIMQDSANEEGQVQINVKDLGKKLEEEGYYIYDENQEPISIFNEEELENLKAFYQEASNAQQGILNDLELQNEALKQQAETLYQKEIVNNLDTGDAQSRFVSKFLSDEEDQVNEQVEQQLEDFNKEGKSWQLWNDVKDIIGEGNKDQWSALVESDDTEGIEELYKEQAALKTRMDLSEGYLKEMNENGLTEEDLQSFFNEINEASASQLEKAKENLKVDDPYDKIKIDYIEENQAELQNLQNSLKGYFSDDVLNEATLTSLQALANNISKAGEEAGITEEKLKGFYQKVEQISTGKGFGKDFINQVAALPWDKLDETNFSQTIKAWAEQIAEDTQIPFDEVYTQLQLIAGEAEKINLADNLTRNEQEVEAFAASLNEVREKAMGQKDTFIKAITDQATLGRVSLDNMLSLQKSLTELGEDYHDYITITNGQAVLDQEKLKTLYADKVNYQKRELQLMLDKAELEKQILQAELDQLGANADSLKIKELTLKINMQDLAIEKLKAEIEFDIGDVALNDFNVGLTDSINSATKTKEDAAKKLADAEEKLAETEQKLQETLYGKETHKNKLDYLYNYATNLDRITKSAEKAKEALSDLQEGDDPQKLLQDFLGAAHAEVVTRTAENEVIAQSIDNYKAVLDTKLGEAIAKINESGDRQISTNISDYYTQIGDRLNVNFSALNAAQLPDEISDYIETTIEEINKLSDQMESNEDSVKKKEKEFLDFKKKLRDDYLKVEDEVVKTLKEKYDEEIKSTEEKYKSIEEADNEYLDALEKAIKKQRELRDSANQYDDLAKKESQLALMQRDTSGARRGDALKLEEDIEKDREKLLDDSVDKMIESMKEMYELQKETREAEIEYQKAVLDNAALVQEANAIIEGWNSADDAVAWFYENTANLSEMSVARLEQETESWRDLYDAKQVYMEASQVDFNQALSYTADEVQKIVEATSQTLTEEADRSLGEITTNVTKAIKDAEKALEEAIRSLQEAQQAASVYGYNNTLNGNSVFSNGKTIDDFINDKNNYTIKTSNLARDAASYQGKIAQIGTDIYSFDKLADFLGKDYNEYDIEKLTYALGMRDENDQRFNTMINYFTSKKNRYAGGGIVDYTGPAWVDGTFDKPEAFLSPEDTERIGKAAQLLSMSPLLNSNSAGNVTTTNVGDTSIEININVENISDDYGVDQMIDRVKQDIVDAYNPIGSSVILRNR